MTNIRAKQLRAGTFDATAAGRAPFGANLFDSATVSTVFADTAIPDVKLASGADFLKRDGSVALTGNLSTAGNRITGLPDALAADEPATKGQLDSVASGIKWKQPVAVKDFIGEASIATINTLSPATGWSVVAKDAGTPTAGTSDLLAAGDLAEFDGTSWKKVIANSGGVLPTGIRLLVKDTATGIQTPITTSDLGKLLVSVANPGTINGTNVDLDDTSEAVDGNAVLVQGPESAVVQSVNENLGFVYDGTVPSGSWVQFTGAGQLNAGSGLTKTANTLNIGDVNKGVQVNADDLQIDASEIAGNGLQQRAGVGNEHLLDIKPDSVATDDAAAVQVGANGLSIDGDLVSIDQVPTNYTRNTAGTGVDVKDLAAHLQGIDDALAVAGGVVNQESVTTQSITGTDAALSDTLNNTPKSNASVRLYLNGILLTQGAGKDYTVSGQTITWLAGTGTAPDMDTLDQLIAVYES